MQQNTALIQQHLNAFTLAEQDVRNKLQGKLSWDSAYREIMLLGKQLALFEPELKQDLALISGCESQVWLHWQWQEDRLHFIASSDSKIVRGLLVIVLAFFNGKTKKQIQDSDQNAYFVDLGLQQHLSPSRTNGIAAIVNKIKAIAEAE